MSGDSRISILQKDGIDVDMDVHTDMSNNTPSEPTDFPDKMTDSNDQDVRVNHELIELFLIILSNLLSFYEIAR